ncbi:GH3 auxin-responsive promoter family protein [Bdellovibrionota bacterium]
MIRPLLAVLAKVALPSIAKKYTRLCEKTEKVQLKLLMDLIKRNADSHFGRQHNFKNIKTVEDFKKALPIRTYKDFEPYIEAVREGEIQALFNAKEKIVAFHLSSGTTAQPKYIPVTSHFYKLHKEIWVYYYSFLFKKNPNILKGKIFPFYSPVSEIYTDLGVPCGSDSGLIAEKQTKSLQSTFAVPWEAYQIPTIDEKYYALVRFAIQEDISFIIGSNPIIMLYLGRLLNDKKHQLIEEVRKGIIDESLNIPEKYKKPLVEKAAKMKDPKRADELEKILKETGTLRPVDIWPKLCAVATWKGGTLNLPLELFPNYFPDLPIWALGLHSSEGRYSITMDAEGSWGCLAITNNFYEFIPEEQRGMDNPDTKLAHELEEGKKYILIITTASGFYRYNLDDLVECVGHHKKAPIVRFLNKGSTIFHFAGVKMYEYQLVEAVRMAIRKNHHYVQYFQFHPMTTEKGLPALGAIFEHKDGISPDDWRKFITTVDTALQQVNTGYGELRASGKADQIVLRIIPENTFEEIKRKRVETAGIRLVEQFKHKYLIEDPYHHEQFVVVGDVVNK